MARVSGGLTAEQRQFFEEQGFLPVPSALSAERVDQLLLATFRIRQEDDAAERSSTRTGDWRSRFHGPSSKQQDECDKHRWQARNIVVRDDSFLDLIDNPTTFLAVVEILGDNIFLMGSHVMVRERTPMSQEEFARFGLDWHRDLGSSAIEMSEPHPRLSVRVAFWLTELNAPGQGAMQVVPGSHRLIGRSAVNPATKHPYGAIEIHAKPGDALIFDQRLWHAAAPNITERPRICLFFAYGYRWLRPDDYREMSVDILERVSPVRRQLLGATVTESGYYLPTAADIPLREWIVMGGVQE
jgi:ectoine hydroxylase-related dioxygenase (phytanoyl-CoA dioxygenase family)